MVCGLSAIVLQVALLVFRVLLAWLVELGTKAGRVFFVVLVVAGLGFCFGCRGLIPVVNVVGLIVGHCESAEDIFI